MKDKLKPKDIDIANIANAYCRLQMGVSLKSNTANGGIDAKRRRNNARKLYRKNNQCRLS